MMAHQTGNSNISSSSNSRANLRAVGDYMVGPQIGSGSFSTVCHARHKISGNEVAIKEIALERLSKKLRDSLLSEIDILKKINHPNIIRLHDIIPAPGRIHLVLEYCRGGDLSMYLNRRGRVPETTARQFMQQLAAGLKVLRENDLIHRDLKPQNLLLSMSDNHYILKIADFGFARSLQPRGLAETLCGSPLYMAPEIMQLQKYDAKADLWSVGVILFQLVTGKTPFTGNNQIQLLQNIMKSNELHFHPDTRRNLSSACIDLCQKLLRRNPVERLTFEEFFNHKFFSQNLSGEPSRTGISARDEFSLMSCNLSRHTKESSQEDYLPFLLDDCNAPDGGFPIPPTRASMRSTSGFGTEMDKNTASKTSIGTNAFSRNSIIYKPENASSRHEPHRARDGSIMQMERWPTKVSPQATDSLEDQDYVVVSSPSMEVSSLSISPSRLQQKSANSSRASVNNNSTLSAPMPITGVVKGTTCGIGSLESHSSAPSGISQGSMELDVLEQPSAHCMTRIRSLRQCASAITELVNCKKIESGRQLEAFSIQLVVLAIWKQALHICHAHAVSVTEGSPSKVIGMMGSTTEKHDPFFQECANSADSQGTQSICAEIEREFLAEVGNAEHLAHGLGPIEGSTEMPDAIETIFQSALALGRLGAVEELMGNMEKAATFYSRAVQLLFFLMVEAPSLILNPPFSLTASDRIRLRSYIDFLNNRQGQSRSQRMALLRYEDPQASP